MGMIGTMLSKLPLRCLFLTLGLTMVAAGSSGWAHAAEGGAPAAPADSAAAAVAHPRQPPAGQSAAKKTDRVPAAKTSAAETTLKGEMTCAKCGLHESAQCQNVLRVKDAAGKQTKYYLRKNAVAEQQHEKVCGGSAAATVTGTVSEEGGKKVLTATSVKFD